MKKVWVVFDGVPGPEGAVFVEVEDETGRSVAVPWQEQGQSGFWKMGPVYLAEEYDGEV